MSNAYIIGIGLTRFGRYPNTKVETLAATAIHTAIEDANIRWNQVQQLYAAHVHQGVALGQRIIKEVGPSGIPVLNIENCSAAASTALREASLAVRSGEFDLVVVVGCEKMRHGVLLNVIPEDDPDVISGLTVLPMRFSIMGKEHMAKYGTTLQQFAAISVKNHQNATLNPNAQYQRAVTLEEVMNSRMIADPITLLSCSPNSDGAAAAVVCSERFLTRLETRRRAVKIRASGLVSDIDELARNRSNLNHVARNAKAVYEKSGVAPEDLDVIETHDCFTVAEVIAYEALGICKEGEGGLLVERGDTELGGRIPVNTSGGLLAKGHPLGATGIGQVSEIVAQLRGEAGPRQVPGARLGLTSNMGMWSSCIHLLEAPSRI